MPKRMIMGELTLASIPVAVHLEAEKMAVWVQVEQGTGRDPAGLGRALTVAPGLEMHHGSAGAGLRGVLLGL